MCCKWLIVSIIMAEKFPWVGFLNVGDENEGGLRWIMVE